MNGTFIHIFCRGTLCLFLVLVALPWSANSAGATYGVTDLVTSPVEGGVTITIQADAPVKYSYFTIGEPAPRLVVDFSDAVHRLPKYRFHNLGTRLIGSIRTSQYRPFPHPSVRVVLDLPELLPFVIKREGNQLVILLEGEAEDLSEKEEPIPPALPPDVGEREVDVSAPSGEPEQVVQEQIVGEPLPESEEVVISPGALPVREPSAEPHVAEETLAVAPVSPEDSMQLGEKVSAPGQPPETTAVSPFGLGIREPLFYSSGGRRDPFIPLPFGQEVEFGQAPLPQVEKLTIVGILLDEGSYRALAQDEENNGYVLRKGDRVLYGYVARIEEDRVVFRLNRRGLDRTVILKIP